MRNPLEAVTLDRLRTRTSMKWRTHPADVLPLWVAEMDVELAPAVARTIQSAATAGDTGYPPGPDGYAEALADFARARWGWDGVRTDRAALVPDVMLGVVEILRVLTDPGDAVVVCPPVYPPFYAFATHADRTVIEAPLGDGYRLDLDALDGAFGAATRDGRPAVFLLCSPHNPTGTVHTHDELTAVAELARTRGVRVVADEIHAPLVLSGARFVPYLSIDERGLALHSASKGWNLAGLKAALLLAGPDVVDDLRRVPEEVGHGASHLGVLAHTAAYRDSGDWLDALLVGLDANRSLLADLVARHLPQAALTRPEATFLAWLDCRALGIEDESVGDGPRVVSELAGPAQFFLDRARVALNAGHTFGTGGSGHVRVNFATSAAVLTEAFTRIGAAVEV